MKVEKKKWKLILNDEGFLKLDFLPGSKYGGTIDSKTFVEEDLVELHSLIDLYFESKEHLPIRQSLMREFESETGIELKDEDIFDLSTEYGSAYVKWIENKLNNIK